MTGRGGGGGRRVLLLPINFIFKLLQSLGRVFEAQLRIENFGLDSRNSTNRLQHATVSVWLYEQLSIRIEGKIRGFDEFMNLVIDDAVEVKQITKTNDKETRRHLGTISVSCKDNIR
ncbi:hypothetical protein N0V84_005393 [Fusarium piperis]|uniref:Sm protein E n=1 Tax=Fusarium piperis TaxID=1435070 RepID=A0A9W8WDW1_9HYPO|nr:hypothetical protein N0V84_005393 [Fusarium piperis]